MPIYSHSQLSTYEQCPLKYKFSYRDKIKRDIEGIEAFLGTQVHEMLRKCYNDARLTKLNSLSDLLAYYDKVWQENWHDSIAITRQEMKKEHYHALGRKLIETYYNRYAPFDADITIATEMRVPFTLGDNDKYKLTGFVDRLSRTKDNIYQIHDYKTSSYLPSQDEADHDRQLALYQIGIQKKWPDIKNIELIWHYLAFDKELVSSCSEDALAKLIENTTKLIAEIESASTFSPNESALCNWCEYPDLCPLRKHFYKVEALPVNEYLEEPGVVLVNKYAELRENESTIKEEMQKVKEAIINYSKREEVEIIKGSDRKVRIKFDQKLKFPGKNDDERSELDKTIQKAGKWMEVSQLDTTSLTKAIDSGSWDKKLIEQVVRFGRLEESSVVYLSKLKDEEK